MFSQQPSSGFKLLVQLFLMPIIPCYIRRISGTVLASGTENSRKESVGEGLAPISALPFIKILLLALYRVCILSAKVLSFEM